MNIVSFCVTSGRGNSFVASMRALMCAGVVPQQPPRMVAMGARGSISAAYSSGLTS